MKSARPILNALRGRGLSAQAAAKTEGRSALSRQDPQVSRLANGAIVASLENNSPLSRVAFIYNAGSRYENGSNLGVTHCLRQHAGLSSAQSTGFAITRNIQQIGGSMTCSSTREHIMYALECTRDAVGEGFEFLGHAATGPAFKPWEMSTANEAVALDLAMLQHQPDARLMEAVHEAAFRSTLGKSLYMNPTRLGSHSPQMMSDFVKQFFVSGNVAIVGVGVDHAELVALAKKTKLPEGQVPAAEKAQYHGGEIRIETGSPLVHAALVTEGAGMTSSDVAAVCVLHQAMGTGPYVKYSNNTATSRAARAAAGASKHPVAASAINASYSDGGIFGFQIAAQAGDAGKVLKAVSGAFSDVTKSGLPDADVTRAKNQVKSFMHMEYESGMTTMEDMAVQAILTGQVMTLSQWDAVVDKVTPADVQAVAKRVINGKPSMAAIGNLSDTPYLDQLL